MPDVNVMKFRTKSEVVRSTRNCAKKMNGRSRVYRRVQDWNESGIGTSNPKFIVTLIPEWSFDEFRIIQKREFSSIHDAMVGISATYPTKHIMCDIPVQPVPELTWQERLNQLIEVTGGNR